MLYIKQNKNMIKSGTFLLPILLSMFAAFKSSYVIFACSFIAMFILIKIMSFCKGHEIVWTFLLSFLIGLPMDLWLLFRLDDYYGYLFDITYTKIVVGALILLIVLTIEEIAACSFSMVFFCRKNSDEQL